VTKAFSKIKKAILLVVVLALFLLVFVLDVIAWKADVDTGWFSLVQNVCLAAAFLTLYVLFESLWKRDQNPIKKIGFGLVVVLIVGIAVGALALIASGNFEVKNDNLIPLSFDAVMLSNVYGVVFGTTAIIILLTLRDIILARRRRGTRRNFIILLALLLASTLASFSFRPLESNELPATLFWLTVIGMALNSYKFSWIVYLSKREKLITLAYSFVLLCLFVLLSVVTAGDGSIGRSLLAYSRPLATFVRGIELFAGIYFGMTFVSTLFHLPTAEAFDRKSSELSSLHNLSRLVTQVFDFDELVNSVTKTTLEVCEAHSAWLEIIREQSGGGHRMLSGGDGISGPSIDIVGLQNISREDTAAILTANGESIRKLARETRKPIVIDDVKSDRRTQHVHNVVKSFDSMVIVPLISHEQTIGILYATKGMQYGFDKQDVELISAFADQATIAIDNSRLIEKSLERERLLREMMLAQDMQRKLLPQQLPSLSMVEIEALSSPAFEVGGDYYDFTMLDSDHLGVLVGDVSGKGVSAAFYMAEMKGIFQSLSKIYPSPKDFLSRAHASLVETIDKRSFISLIYAVLDLRTGRMQVARAGHCPMVYATKERATFVKPRGLGLGMGTSEFFERTIVQEDLQLSRGDVVVLYTDGVTEAHNKQGEEFGYERLLDVVRRSVRKSATEIRESIITAVDEHMQHESPEDDLTLVIMKWTM
jgi:sigma-B regulation protein RsbU (phosphoserine phosphatase)